MCNTNFYISMCFKSIFCFLFVIFCSCLTMYCVSLALKEKIKQLIFLSSDIFAKTYFPLTDFLRVCCYSDDCLKERVRRSNSRWTCQERNTYFMSLFLTEPALVFTPLLLKFLQKKGTYLECFTVILFAFTKMLLQSESQFIWRISA